MAIKNWTHMSDLPNRPYVCGHCGVSTGSNKGYWKNAHQSVPNLEGFPHSVSAMIFLCMRCEKPTYFEVDNDSQSPPPPFGSDVVNLPEHVKTAYAEARNCMLVAAYTAAALMCRKILMNVAVAEGAPGNLKFIEYVKYFKDNNYIPPKGDKWFDFIRDKGNEATHEIPQITKDDAEHVLKFSETILTLAYDFPNRIS